MSRKTLLKWTLLSLICSLFWTKNISAVELKQNQSFQEDQELEEKEALELAEEVLLEEIQMEEIQRTLDELVGKGKISLKEEIKKIMQGEDPISKAAVQEFLQSFFLSFWKREKENFIRIITLLFLAAVLSNFTIFFEKDQIGDIGFYILYLVLFTMSMNFYSELSESLLGKLKGLTEFMKVLAPSYFLAVAAANGTATAAVFYQGILFLIWGIEWLMVSMLLPMADFYVLLQMLNALSKEEMLSRMSELLKEGIEWALKTMVGVVAGLQMIKNLVAPVLDELKKNVIGRAASAIPGIGNTVNVATELILTSALLVKNSLGVAMLMILVLTGAGPVLYYAGLSLSYRFIAAVFQPISDKRVIGCIVTMGEGIGLLLRILLTAEILCMLTFLIIMAGGR